MTVCIIIGVQKDMTLVTGVIRLRLLYPSLNTHIVLDLVRLHYHCNNTGSHTN